MGLTDSFDRMNDDPDGSFIVMGLYCVEAVSVAREFIDMNDPDSADRQRRELVDELIELNQGVGDSRINNCINYLEGRDWNSEGDIGNFERYMGSENIRGI